MLAMDLKETAFVFAVCGNSRFINELSLALKALQRYSKACIYVVTDRRRNEVPVRWDNVWHVDTPEHLTDHEASIYLKTSLHRILPVGPRYCYLDSDIFAVSSAVDDVFSATDTPVSFAADSCRLHQFSPYATNCQCMQTNSAEREEINALLADAHRLTSGSQGGWSPIEYEYNAQRRVHRAFAYAAHLLMPRSTSQKGEAHHQLWPTFWYESRTQKLHKSKDEISFVERASAWRRDRRRQSWISPAGNDVFNLHCHHLVESIRDTFGICVAKSHWQHWNGGVFLFDLRAHAFLDAWHEKTIRIFGLPGWRTRDQGTLVATVWEYGLESQPLLPSRFNCILDPNRGATMVSMACDSLTTDAFLTTITPVMAHVISGVDDYTWDVWRWVSAHAFQEENVML
jgi:hypothetical protein